MTKKIDQDETNEVIDTNEQINTETVPEGWTVVEESNADVPKWDFEANPVMIGNVSQKQTINIKDGDTSRPTIVATVNVDGKDYIIWQSAALLSWLKEAYVGQAVYIKYKGKKSIGKGRTMKDFTVATQPGR